MDIISIAITLIRKNNDNRSQSSHWSFSPKPHVAIWYLLEHSSNHLLGPKYLLRYPNAQNQDPIMQSYDVDIGSLCFIWGGVGLPNSFYCI